MYYSYIDILLFLGLGIIIGFCFCLGFIALGYAHKDETKEDGISFTFHKK